MKWIGQHIYDLASRFRNDVFLEDVSTGTIASGAHLGLDSNNKIVKAVDGGGDLTSIVAGTGLSGTSLTGPIPTLNVDASLTHVTGVGTITTGDWRGTAIASTYLDADTAHLSEPQTFTGTKTFDGDRNVTPGDGAVIHVDSHDVTDTNTSASGTAAMYTHVNIEAPRLLATEEGVTTTAAATLYVKGAAAVGTNQTVTNNYALWVDDGLVKFDGALTVGGTITGDVTGALTGNASGTAATVTAGTQTAITSCANLVTVGTIGTGVWNGSVIASAYLDADTAHYSLSRQLTHHMINDDINTDKIYIGLQEADAETATATNKNLPLLAPVAGKLLKVFLRAAGDLSGETLTWRLETVDSSTATSSTPSGTFGTQSGAGCTASSMTTYDFTSSLDAGSNAIAAGDTVQLSIQSGGDPGGNIKYYITCLWEWDLS